MCGFSIFEITRCGSVPFLYFENRTVRCGAVFTFSKSYGAVRCGFLLNGAMRYGLCFSRIGRCGAVIRCSTVVSYGAVERAP